MNGQTVALVITLALLIPALAYGILWSTRPDRRPKYQPRRSAGRQAAFQRNVDEMTKAMQSMVPAFQQMGAATKRAAAEAMKRLGAEMEKGKHRQ